MNREIKFRAWNKYSKRFEYICEPNGFKFWLSGHGDPPESMWPETLEQFTGLKDKNGKEIYEGDIINFKSEYSDVFQITIMRFGPYLHKNQGGYDHIKCLGFYLECPSTLESCFVDDDLFDSDLEIIGNIYENPELSK